MLFRFSLVSNVMHCLAYEESIARLHGNLNGQLSGCLGGGEYRDGLVLARNADSCRRREERVLAHSVLVTERKYGLVRRKSK